MNRLPPARAGREGGVFQFAIFNLHQGGARRATLG